jgi:hypothetical protein
MRRLAEKYVNLWREDPDKAVKTMINEGIISTSWPGREELFELYNKMKAEKPGRSKADICDEISIMKKVASNTVRDAIDRLK